MNSYVFLDVLPYLSIHRTELVVVYKQPVLVRAAATFWEQSRRWWLVRHCTSFLHRNFQSLLGETCVCYCSAMGLSFGCGFGTGLDWNMDSNMGCCLVLNFHFWWALNAAQQLSVLNRIDFGWCTNQMRPPLVAMNNETIFLPMLKTLCCEEEIKIFRIKNGENFDGISRWKECWNVIYINRAIFTSV